MFVQVASLLTQTLHLLTLYCQSAQGSFSVFTGLNLLRCFYYQADLRAAVTASCWGLIGLDIAGCSVKKPTVIEVFILLLLVLCSSRVQNLDDTIVDGLKVTHDDAKLIH